MYLNVSGDIVLYAFIGRLSEAIAGVCWTGGVLPRAGIDGWHHLRVSGLGLYQIGGRWRWRPRRPLLVDLTRIWQNLVMAAIIWLLYLLLKMMMSCSVRRGCLGARLHVMRVWSRRARPRWRHQRWRFLLGAVTIWGVWRTHHRVGRTTWGSI